MVKITFQDGKRLELEETEEVILPREFMEDLHYAIHKNSKGKNEVRARGISEVAFRDRKLPGAKFFIIDFEDKHHLLFEILPGEKSKLVAANGDIPMKANLRKTLINGKIRLII